MTLYASKVMRVVSVAAATALALFACGKDDGGAASQQAQGSQQQQDQPAPEVRVATVHPEAAVLTTELSGRLGSLYTAEVHAQVGGILQRRLFQESSYVQAGQPLYQIDGSTREANLGSARAQLASTQATLTKTNADLVCYKPLVAADAISQQEYDAAVTARRSTEASVKSTQAAIKSADISLSRSCITAPISGFIGQSKVSEGTLLNSGDTTVLATIQQTNPMYVNVTRPAGEVMKLRQQVAEGRLLMTNDAITVGIKPDDGTVYPEKSRLLFADPAVNETTGQITLCAAVPNDRNILIPGLCVHVLMEQVAVGNASVVPQQTVTHGSQDIAMVVNNKSEMEMRVVTIAQQQDTNWVITDGLKDDDKMAVEGTNIAAMSGAKKVTPKEWTPLVNAAAATPAVSGGQATSEAKPEAKVASETK